MKKVSFEDFRFQVVSSFAEMHNTMVDDGDDFDGETVYGDAIPALQSSESFYELASILVDMEYWEEEDATIYSQHIK